MLCTEASFTLPLPNHPIPTVLIREQPDLTLGAYVWDCAIIQAWQFAHSKPYGYLTSKTLQPFPSFKELPQRPPDRPNSVTVIDLGSGCGLTGLCMALTLEQFSNRGVKHHVIMTDTEAVVGASTRPNLELSRSRSSTNSVSLGARVLNWEEPLDMPCLGNPGDACLITASDVCRASEIKNAPVANQSTLGPVQHLVPFSIDQRITPMFRLLFACRSSDNLHTAY